MHPLSSFPLFLAVLPIYLIECHLGKRNLSCKWNFTLCFPPSTPPYHPGHSRLWWKPVVHVVGYRIHSDRWHTFFSFFTIICWFSKLEKKIQVTPTCIDLHLKYVAPNCSNAGRSVSTWFLISPNDDFSGSSLSLSSVRLFATPWTVAYQAPPSMGFSRQESWSGLPFPSPGDLPNPGIEPRSPTVQADALTSEPPGKPMMMVGLRI